MYIPTPQISSPRLGDEKTHTTDALNSPRGGQPPPPPRLWMNYGPWWRRHEEDPNNSPAALLSGLRGARVYISPPINNAEHPGAQAINGFNAGLYFTTPMPWVIWGFKHLVGEKGQSASSRSFMQYYRETGPRLGWWKKRLGPKRDHCWLLRISVSEANSFWNKRHPSPWITHYALWQNVLSYFTEHMHFPNDF